MPKQSRKRQRSSKDEESKSIPLGSVIPIHDDDKDEEERRLESLLFGTPYIPAPGSTEKNVLLVQEDEDDTVEETGKELDNLQDDDVS
jgi:U3 small nucleolar RNA-associated protein 18